MKTTSRSESINSFFNSYSQANDFLINFMMNYDNAIQRLRYIQRELDQKTKMAQYIMKTPRDIEIHAALVYTCKMFLEVQKEMFKGSWYCDVTDCNEGDGWEIFTIVHKNKKHQVKSRHKVIFFMYQYVFYLLPSFSLLYIKTYVCCQSSFLVIITCDYIHIC